PTTQSTYPPTTPSPPPPTLFPYTTLFRSAGVGGRRQRHRKIQEGDGGAAGRDHVDLQEGPQVHLHGHLAGRGLSRRPRRHGGQRSEEHTSELQSRFDLVCRLLLEKKKNIQ